MENANGSKSARNPKVTKTPAQGAPAEVTIENGATLVLPNPADAPQPKAAGRKKKAASTVTGAPPGTEVPDWAKRAAARDTAAEMAAVPQAAPTPEATPGPPVAKKGRAGRHPKAKPAGVADGAAKPGSLRAIGSAWIEALRAGGHTKSTLSSYAKDLDLAYEFLGADVGASEITEKQIAAFNTCKGVLKKKSGKPKAKPTILKTRRALRLALTWAEQKALIKKAPFAAKTPA
jgi:hypothetical protein